MIAEHIRKPSLFQKRDPRTLLVAATCAAFCFSFMRNLIPSCLCLAFALLLAAVSGLHARSLIKRLAVANVFILFIWLTVPLTMPGESLATFGPLTWSRVGIRLAALVTLKCNAILLAVFSLVAGIGLSRIGCALEQLHVPAKLVFLFLFTCRYIHVIGEEWQRLQTAAKLRGFVPRNSFHTYKTIADMLGLTFINAVDRSRRIYEAMLLRGFNGTFNTVAELRRTSADVWFLLLFFAAVGSILFLDRHLK
ncbi:MAG: cobalt ECF transporter T component CbiQ [Planctomycetota bacterium]|jgi:cobalt/nickel transport system permease protein|nr:cobalt ECF transporter T component CbiQ [Planctomycetota bacterium]